MIDRRGCRVLRMVMPVSLLSAAARIVPVSAGFAHPNLLFIVRQELYNL
jgi:hypothetical protein